MGDYYEIPLDDWIPNIAITQLEDGTSENEEKELPPVDHENQLPRRRRTYWYEICDVVIVIVLSILAVFGIMACLLALIEYMVPMPATQLDNDEFGMPMSFHRPETDYILNRNWDLNAAPKIREHNFIISNIVGDPDGVTRPLIAINNQFPGPLIECNEGDVLVINVDNNSTNATSIHFHGIYQNGTNWMDGTSGVTQCPIVPGRKFEYKFNVTGQSGTYFYHGHQGVQASDGLYGPLVVHSRRDRKLQKIPYASDRVVMLQDHYHHTSDALLYSSMQPGAEGAPTPDGALINGHNVRDCSSINDQTCDNSNAIRATFELEESSQHQLRFINVGALAYFHVGIDEHEFTVTEVDGTEVLPSLETRLMIAPAQRYSVVVPVNHTSNSSFWLRARMMTHCWGDNPEDVTPEKSEVLGIIQYVLNSTVVNKASTRHAVSFPTSKPRLFNLLENCLDMPKESLIPAIPNPPPRVATRTYNLRSNIEIGNWRLERGYFNTSSFRPDVTSPTLHRLLSIIHSNATSSPDGINDIDFDTSKELVLQHGNTEVVDLIIHNYDEGSHPIHLHGHKFWILASGHGKFPGYESIGLAADGRGTLEHHEHALDNVLSRDVATLQNFGYLVIRVVLDNPGVWMLHCHMAWHSEKGLAMVLASRTDDMRRWEVPLPNQALCGASKEELEKGTPPDDDIWVGDFGTDGGTEEVVEEWRV